jgi:hypothetical protein
MIVTWNYNGSNQLQAILSASTVGKHYTLVCGDNASSPVTVAGTGGALTVTVTTIGGNSPGEQFYAYVYSLDDNDIYGANVFAFGSSSTTGVGIAGITWDWDGTSATADFTSSVADTYRLNVNYLLAGSVLSNSGTDAGTSVSLTATPGGSPDPGTSVVATISDDDTPNGSAVAIRIFLAGATGSGTEGSPTSGGTDTGTGSSGGGSSSGGSDGGTDGPLIIKIYDLASTELVEITSIAFEPSLEVDMDKAGPWQFTLTCPSDHSLLTTVADDGYQNLRKGNRKLIVWEKGKVIFHGRIFVVDRTGDGKENLVAITAYNPWMELGFDADDRAGRPVRDETGNFIDPTFNSDGPASGPDLIKQILTNSQGTDDEGGANPGEGPLPIALTGTFDLSVPPAVDLSPSDTMDWPVLCGDFVTQLMESGVCDVYMRPVDPAEDLDPYVMVELSAVSLFGDDKSATVHFDYFTGSKNAAEAEHIEDFSTICNKLYDYLGPRIDQEHWRANITPGSPGVTVDPTDSRTLYGGPGEAPGTFMHIREFDSIGDESSNRPLYLALFNAEQGYRMEPRDLLYITPVKGAAALFDPPHDFTVGDLVTQNVGAALGVALAEAQRVYGFTKTWNREFVPTVSRLVTSADGGG